MGLLCAAALFSQAYLLGSSWDPSDVACGYIVAMDG